jgi:hypothetical protein
MKMRKERLKFNWRIYSGKKCKWRSRLKKGWKTNVKARLKIKI